LSARLPIINRYRAQGHWLPDFHGHHLLTLQRKLGREISGQRGPESGLSSRTEVGTHDDGIDCVGRPKGSVCSLGYTISGEGPYHLFISEIIWNMNPEDELVASRKEMGGLPSVWPSGLKIVPRTNGYVDLLFPVPVVIPEQQIKRAVWIRFESFVYGRDVLTTAR
jgi:hypothetical protein